VVVLAVLFEGGLLDAFSSRGVGKWVSRQCQHWPTHWYAHLNKIVAEDVIPSVATVAASEEVVVVDIVVYVAPNLGQGLAFLTGEAL